MKTSSLVLVLILSTSLNALAANPTPKAKPPKNRSPKPHTAQVQRHRSQKPVPLTGSYIWRKIRRRGAITDGPTPVYVLDRKTIDVTGAADLSQVLSRSGFRR